VKFLIAIAYIVGGVYGGGGGIDDGSTFSIWFVFNDIHCGIIVVVVSIGFGGDDGGFAFFVDSTLGMPIIMLGVLSVMLFLVSSLISSPAARESLVQIIVVDTTTVIFSGFGSSSTIVDKQVQKISLNICDNREY